MPAKPNTEMLERVKTLLPTATITHSNNTIIVTASSDEVLSKWAKLLIANRIVSSPHSRFPLTLVISMWPSRQINIRSY